MALTLKKTSKKLFPEGIYAATVEKLEEAQSKFDPQKNTVTIWFKTPYKSRSDESGWTMQLSCTASLHENSKLTPIVEMLLGRKFEENEEVDLNTILGKECRIFVEHRVSEKTGKKYASVTKVLPRE